MKSKVKKLDGTARQLEVEVPKEAVDKVFSQVLADVKKDVNVPGFRPGNAPDDIIQKQHKDHIMDEVKQRLVPEGYQSALQEHGLMPASYPEISDINIGIAGTLTFKAVVDLQPEVTVKQYKGIKVTTKKIHVDDSEVTEAMDRIQNMSAEFTDTDGPIKKGEYGICDVETTMDGEIISKKRENMWVEADKEASMLGIGEEIIGLKKGDKKDIEATLPEKYPDKKYAGKKAVFHVEVKETKEKKLPELDEEFAKKWGKENMEEVRLDLKDQLFQRKEADVNISMKNQIMEQLIKKNSFAIPKTMVARQLKVLMEKAENELAHKGVAKEVIESHKDKLKTQLEKEAEDKVKLYFILDEVANKENIQVDDDEVESWIKSLAESYGKDVDEVKKYYQEHNLIEGLKEQLREDKALDFLLSEAVIKAEK